MTEIPVVSQDANKTHVNSPAAPLKTLHSSNVSFCRDPGSLPPHLAARRLRMRKVCAFLKTHSPLLRRRRLTTTLLSKLRWDISHHILYCPVPQVGLPWARYILGSVGVQSSSVTSNNVDVLLGRRLPSPSLEVLEVFALGDGVRVMVAQHPFTRLASAYLTLMEEANSTHTSKSPKGTKGGEHTHSQARVAVPASFREFCRHVTHTIEQWVASPHLPPPDPRWMPVIYLCSPCTVNYTIISNVECFDSDVKFITDYCGLRGKARDALSGEQSSLQRPGHTEETRYPAEDDGVRCVEESKQESLLTEVIKEGRESYFSSISNRGMGGSVRALFNQLSEEEVDRLYRVYQHDFDLLQYRPL
ncbi:hypothetical protein O3P69_013608 [Scylla paramamosain]|uniref:Carbohydrate sulfotransferase n=1 Tax=Scylla paramamosain TaxID=85552 RepID=A0AAW0SQ07_SCYPA